MKPARITISISSAGVVKVNKCDLPCKLELEVESFLDHIVLRFFDTNEDSGGKGYFLNIPRASLIGLFPEFSLRMNKNNTAHMRSIVVDCRLDPTTNCYMCTIMRSLSVYKMYRTTVSARKDKEIGL